MLHYEVAMRLKASDSASPDYLTTSCGRVLEPVNQLVSFSSVDRIEYLNTHALPAVLGVRH